MIWQEMQRREVTGSPIRVGASALGWMGHGFVNQVAHVPGMEVVVVANEDIAAARRALLHSGVHDNMVVEANSPELAMDILRAGKRVVTGDYSLAAQLEDVDIVVDVTPSPAIGAETAYACIQNCKDVVLVNIEADTTVGTILHRLARRAGTLYTVSSGDEPGCLMELFDFVMILGYEPIVIGKGKNNPLDTSATPDSVAEIAQRDDKDPYQVASYVDGTKTMFEMACIANATGFVPMKRGMTGPEATLETIPKLFALVEDGGITPFPGVVDFVQGENMAGGVFVIARVEDTRIQKDLEYLKVGKGKYYTFFRPYHLWFLEAPISVAKAYLFRQTTLVPLEQPATEVLSIAKRDLRPGERLDNFGGYTFHGMLDRAETARALNALPAGLAPGARITQYVSSGEIIAWSDVELDEASLVVRLRRQQDNNT